MLEINIPTIVFEILNFIVLAALLYFFLLKPGIKKVQARTEARMKIEREIQENLDASERTRTEMETRLENIQDNINTIVEKNRKQMEVDRQEILQDVKEEALEILESARFEAADKQKQAMVDFQDKVLNAIIEISSQVIGKFAPADIHDVLLKQMNDRIWQLGRDEMSRVETVRRSLDKRNPMAYVRSARPMTPEQRGQLIRTLSALADNDVELELTIEPHLTAGIYVRIGDIVLDNSISAQLEEYRQEIKSMIEEKVADE